MDGCSELMHEVRELDMGAGSPDKGLPGRGKSRCKSPEAGTLAGGFEEK